MKFDLSCWIVAAATALCLPACSHRQGSVRDSTSPVRVEVSPLARTAATLHLDSLRLAFLQLPAFAFTRRVETTQFAPDGGVRARTVSLLRYEGTGQERSGDVRTISSTGTFDFGFFGSSASKPDLGENLASFADLIPTDPPYLSARSRDNFIFQAGADTVIAGMSAAVLVIRAAPDAQDQATRLARLYYDPESRNVVALYLEQENPAFLFRERTTSYIQATIDEEGGWLPDTTRVDTHVHLPFTAARHFRTASRFSDFAFGLDAAR
ncbi:MAG TPA: hypothetical protein VFG50_02170 [Rhodothermales bacterium]|nr:hypothetical protein [Rhodothermales bacterium]